MALPAHGPNAIRLLHIHQNRPGVLTQINQIFAEEWVNIAAQYLQTGSEIGYVVIDIEAEIERAGIALRRMKAIEGTIRTRLLF